MYASFKAFYVFLNAENKTNALQKGGKREEKEKKMVCGFLSTCIRGGLSHHSSYDTTLICTYLSVGRSHGLILRELEKKK